MPFPLRGRAAAALALFCFLALSLPAPAARAMTDVDFDALASPSAASAASLGILSIVDALVLSEADANLLTGLSTANWATSGDQGILNTLTASIVFEFSSAVSSFRIEVLGLPDVQGAPTPIMLEAFRGATSVASDLSDISLIGDSGFHEDTLMAADALGITRVVLSPGTPCVGAECDALTTTFWGDTVQYERVPEPGVAWLAAGGLAALGLRRRRRLAAALLAPCLLVLGACVPKPQIVTPADQSSVDAAAASIPVDVQLGGGFGAGSTYQVVLLAGIDTAAPTITDITARFGLAGSQATGNLMPATDLIEGRNSLFVNIDGDGDGTADNTVSSSFSYEPDLKLGLLDPAICDVLDTADCLYPFPSDFHTREDTATDTDLRIDFHRDAMPANAFGVHVDPTEWNRNDGFSPGSAVQTIVPGLALETPSGDPAVAPTPMPGAAPIWDIAKSLEPDASFLIIDSVTGERVLLWAELNSQFTSADRRALILRPGINLQNGRRYIVALRNLRNAAGEILEPQRAFRLYRDGIPTYVPAIEDRRPHMEHIFDELATAGVARNELYLAWDFTVASKRNVSERLLHMRDDAFADLGTDAPGFTVTEIDVRPASDTRILRRIRGTYQVPLYLTNNGDTGGVQAATRLYCEDAVGQQRLCEGDELPMRAGTYNALFMCVIPRTASADGNDPVVPGRPSLYGHGLLGRETEVGASHVAAMAFEHNMVFCGTRMIGMDDDDEPTAGHILTDFSRFPTLADRMHQGVLNSLFLGRLMIHPDGFASHAAFQAGAGDSSVIDPSELFYDGNSQGAISGGAVAAFAQDFTRAVLGVAGMNYSTLLLRSVDFDSFLFIFELTYLDPAVRLPAISLAQMLWNRVEASGHATHLTADTYDNTPAKKILLHVAFGDFQVADVSAEVEARSIGASIHRPAFDPSAYIAQNPANEPRPFFQVDPYFGIPAIPTSPPLPPLPDAPGATYDWDGSALIIWDSGNLQSPVTNMPPAPLGNPELSACALDHGQDPHECPRRQPSARVQKSYFLSTGGSVVDVCAGQTCLAPLP